MKKLTQSQLHRFRSTLAASFGVSTGVAQVKATNAEATSKLKRMMLLLP